MFIVSHYKSDYKWVKKYTEDYIIYDKEYKNVGYNIYDILSFIIEFYDNLPKTCVFVKDNVMERHITKKEFNKLIKNKTFTPLLTKDHKTDGTISRYVDGVYEERNDSWYLPHYGSKHFKTYKEFAEIMELPNPPYLPFAPGANYIVPRANILKHPKSFYKKLLSFVSYTQLPGEAHAIERALYTIFK